MAKSAALEAAACGVRVDAVAPGPTETGMLDRFSGTPAQAPVRKTALATGGSRGIGRARALALAKGGGEVLVRFGRGGKEAEAVVTAIWDAGGSKL
jgi:NAD(P)-dependent dehydrogenase (short-subunit alcohol dehydrogenase family)